MFYAFVRETPEYPCMTSVTGYGAISNGKTNAKIIIAMISTDMRRFVLLLFMLNIFPLNPPGTKTSRLSAVLLSVAHGSGE